LANQANGELKTVMRDVWTGLPAEDRFARLIDALPAALALVRPDGHIEVANQQCEHMFGFDRDELRDRPLEVLVPERFHDAHAGLLHRFATALSSRRIEAVTELLGSRKDGTEFPLEIDFSPIELDGTAMVVAIIADVTAPRRVQAEQEVERAELLRSNADL
jgi:PAS domain S-box-containing protein